MILVTGATGLVGSQIVYDLVKDGMRVRALRRQHSVIPLKLIPYQHLIEWKIADVTDLFALEEAMMHGVDHVYHCAALVSFNPAKKAEMFRVNIEGTANVVNLCLELGVKKLVHVSSIAAIGNAKPGEVITEKNRWEYSKSSSDYSISKHESEREVWRGILEGLNAVIINPSIIIGDPSIRTASHKLFELAQAGMRFYTEGTVGMVDVSDVSAAAIALMNSEISEERFIVSAENISYREFFDTASEAFGTPKPQRYASPFLLGLAWRAEKIRALLSGRCPGLTRNTARSSHEKLLYSSEKICKALGFTFRPLRESITAIARQYHEG